MTRRQSLPMLASQYWPCVSLHCFPFRQRPGSAPRQSQLTRQTASTARSAGSATGSIASSRSRQPSRRMAQPPAQVTATQELDAVTGELRELKARAILEPTPANVTAYIRFQRAQLDRASLFSDVWQRAIWQDPELDYTLERRSATLAKKQWQDARAADRDAVMAQALRALRPVLFLRPDLRRLRSDEPDRALGGVDRWHITVRAISTDGGPSRHFPTTRSKAASAPRMGLEPGSRPALVLWDSVARRPIPIGYGVLSRRRAAGPHLPPHLEGSRT